MNGFGQSAKEHGAHYVDPGRNLGFAAGVNLGLAQRRRPDYDVLLLNPDATVTLDGVSDLHRCLHRRADLACAAPSQVDPTGTDPARVGWPFPTPLGAWVEAIGLGRLRRGEDFMIGSVLLVRAAALAEVGEFDEQFFLYAEETDWQRRAYDLGWTMALLPRGTATHIGAGTGGDSKQRSVHFHASQERYIRKHHGSLGWQVYRWGMMAGALLRRLILPGTTGPLGSLQIPSLPARSVRGRVATVTPTDRRHLSIVHVVVTNAFAGVERYVCQVVNELSARGHRVTTIGGDPSRMREELAAGVENRPADTLIRAAIALARSRRADIVHVHMTAAEGAAWLARPRQRAPLVATRHFARDRGSSPAVRALSRVTSRAISRDIAISQFVADRISGPSILIPNGVPDQAQAELQSNTAVMLQRLDSEKAPEVGVRAWSVSGLGDLGWRLVVAGDGELRPSLSRLADDLGVAESIDFLGQVTGTDDLLARASMFLAPAPEEPFGLSVVEAMAHGIPVVAAKEAHTWRRSATTGSSLPPVIRRQLLPRWSR